MSKENNCGICGESDCLDCCSDMCFGDTVQIGDKLPDISFKVFHENDEKEMKISDFEGKWLILFFYPADFTFVCPTELGDLADHYDELQKMGVEVYAVSTDTHFTHKAWHDTSETIKKIKFPMIGDPTGAISRNFDVMIEEEGLALRGTFIINPEGIIKTAEVNDLGIGRSAADLVRKVQAAQHIAANPNQACPASWKPGEEALTPSLDLVGKI